ncbi:MAG: hypothetical protein IPK16_27490 [Anaerolineales bacterium]|nr:hypothetical protein [Anaerolineales bacterium]
MLPNGADPLALCRWAAQNEFYLCTLAASDERMLEDNALKVYVVLSGSDRQLAILEHPIERDSFQYLSFHESFPSALPLERSHRPVWGGAQQCRPRRGMLLHPASFPPDLYPLRRNRTNERLRRLIAATKPVVERSGELPYGVMRLLVGPIHAGVIEAGHPVSMCRRGHRRSGDPAGIQAPRHRKTLRDRLYADHRPAISGMHCGRFCVCALAGL